jgi:hypothetical protein
MSSLHVAHEYMRSMVPSLGSFRPWTRGWFFCSSYLTVSTNNATISRATYHRLRVDDVHDAHRLDLLRREQAELDLLDRPERTFRLQRCSRRHDCGCGGAACERGSLWSVLSGSRLITQLLRRRPWWPRRLGATPPSKSRIRSGAVTLSPAAIMREGLRDGRQCAGHA